MLVLNIRLFGKPYSICFITEEECVFPDESFSKVLGLQTASHCTVDIDDYRAKRSFNLVTTSLFLRPFLRECLVSNVYRMMVLDNFTKLRGYAATEPTFLKLKLEPPDREILDYAWNERMLRLIWTRVEIENAFSWLSTLGGAYSALGDYFEYCAEEAGRISERQYKLSIMLGDEGLAARSKLYTALSAAQKGKLRLSRHIVRKVADFAKTSHDRRLMRMCHGVWAKLKYLRGLKKQLSMREDGDKNFEVVNGSCS